MRVLVTGAGGYVGRHMVDRLRDAGYGVRAVVRRSAPGLPGEVVHSDLTDVAALPRMLDGVDVVVHCAARVGGGTRADFERDNLLATERLLRAAGERPFIHISTMGVYGFRELVDADEDTPFAPSEDPYAVTKILAEARVRAHPGPWLIVRPAVVWGGPHDNRLMGAVRRLASTRTVVFPGACRTPMPWTHVDNLADLVLAAIAQPGVSGIALNAADGSLADGISVSFRDFVLRYGVATGRPFRLTSALPLPFVHWAVRTGGALARTLSVPWPNGLRPEVLALFNTPCTLSVALARARLGVTPSPREHLR